MLGRFSIGVMGEFGIRMYSHKCPCWMPISIACFKAKQLCVTWPTFLWNV